MKKIKFINEIGNTIIIKIKKHNDYGINYKTKEKKKYNGVSISIIGPTSMSENEITLQEAKELYKLLGQFLKE